MFGQSVIGNSASGKSTLGARLAQALDAAFVELDACLSDPRWAHMENGEELVTEDSLYHIYRSDS